MLQTIFATHTSTGLLILRVAVAAVMLAHGWSKLFTEGKFTGPGQLAGFLKMLKIPLPGFFAWVVALLETVGAVLLILGLGTRILAIGFAIDMLVAIVNARIGMGKAKFAGGNAIGWEFEFVLLAGAIVLFLTGAGLISLDRLVGL